MQTTPITMSEINEMVKDHIIVNNEIKHSYLIEICPFTLSRRYHWDISKAKLFTFNEAMKVRNDDEGALYAF